VTASGDRVVESHGITTHEDPISIQTSVVIPAYNERNNLRPLLYEIVETFQSERCQGYTPVEIIVVDDRSTDGSREELRDLARELSPVTAVFLRRNFGQTAALAAGIDCARGELIVTMDADRQNDPADVPDLLDKLSEGYDCVSGWRRGRDDPVTKTIPSRIQTYLAQLTGPDIHDFGCTLKAYRAEALRELDLYGEGHRYIPAKLHKWGYDITEIPVEHRPRTEGKSKYGLRRLLRGTVDLGFTFFWNRYSTRPLHFLGWMSFVCFVAGTSIGVYSLALKYVWGETLLANLPKLLLSVALILFGVQLLTFGLLAEMITKVYYRDSTPYRIETVDDRGE